MRSGAVGRCVGGAIDPGVRPTGYLCICSIACARASLDESDVVDVDLATIHHMVVCLPYDEL